VRRRVTFQWLVASVLIAALANFPRLQWFDAVEKVGQGALC
jgi:hypothetical protein